MTKDEALKLALEALKQMQAKANFECWNLEICDKAIKAIQEALAQPAQEPTAWGYRNNAGAIYDCISPEAHADEEGDYDVPLYTTPPQRPWVGLTDDEAQWLYDNCRTPSNLIDMVESKLKEKNS